MPRKTSIGIVTAALVWAALLGGCQSIRNDFTTTPSDPPVFEAIAALPENQGRDMGYPYPGDEAPAIPPLSVPGLETDPAAVLAKVEAAAGAMTGWEIVAVDRERLRIEAVATTSLLEFKDDVAVEIRQRATPDGNAADTQGAEAGSDPSAVPRLQIHMRSKSRVGRYDFGANEKRVALFFDRLEAAFAE